MFVYALQSKSTGKIYIGYTSNLENRIKRHNGFLPTKSTSYTHKQKGPWVVVYRELCENTQQARKREKELKTAKGSEFIKKQISAHSSAGRALAS